MRHKCANTTTRMTTLIGDLVVLAVRIYMDSLALAGLVLVRLSYALIRAPYDLLFGPRLPRKPFQSVFITGASVGLGAGLAKAFAGPDVKLYITARSLQALQSTKLACEAKGAVVTCFATDVCDAKQMELDIQQAHAVQPLDLVIANAGICTQHDGLKESRLVLETNVLGTANTIVPALELMLRETRSAQGYRPQLVLMSSMGGFGPSASLFMAPYVASKSAIKIYAESLRNYLYDKHIGVSVIMPGMTESRMVTEQSKAGIHPVTGVCPIETATRLMHHGIYHDHAEIAYPFVWTLIAKTFGNMPGWVQHLCAPLARKNDPYTRMDRRELD